MYGNSRVRLLLSTISVSEVVRARFKESFRQSSAAPLCSSKDTSVREQETGLDAVIGSCDVQRGIYEACLSLL